MQIIRSQCIWKTHTSQSYTVEMCYVVYSNTLIKGSNEWMITTACSRCADLTVLFFFSVWMKVMCEFWDREKTVSMMEAVSFEEVRRASHSTWSSWWSASCFIGMTFVLLYGNLSLSLSIGQQHVLWGQWVTSTIYSLCEYHTWHCISQPQVAELKTDNVCKINMIINIPKLSLPWCI